MDEGSLVKELGLLSQYLDGRKLSADEGIGLLSVALGVLVRTRAQNAEQRDALLESIGEHVTRTALTRKPPAGPPAGTHTH